MAKQANSGWLSRAKEAAKSLIVDTNQVDDIKPHDYAYGYDGVTVQMLLGSGKRSSRNRQEIYQKWHYMMGDPIIASAISLHVTQALGGHETTGDTVFIEPTPDIEKTGGEQQKKIVEDLQRSLAPLFNKIAFQVAYNAAGFGDSYGRVYVKEGVGVVDVYVDELIYPPLVQPYEQANKTVGFVVSATTKVQERLSIKQMARMKMPRKNYVPQVRAIDKALKAALTEDDIEKLPLMPSLVGGSFLEAAEEPYDNLMSALAGLVGQRILGTIDESMIGVNMEGMTKEQRLEFMTSLKNMLQASKDRAAKAVADGTPMTSRFYHLMPTFNEKQMVSVNAFQGSSSTNSITIEDVMLHAKLLAGALGIDLSMLGFSDMLSGGLGEGGFFRVSAQAAERSRVIRQALSQFFHDIIDIHTMVKYGWCFDDGDRPYKVNFYGSISALESEQQANKERSINSTAMLVQTLTGMRDLGMNKDINKQVLSRFLGMDEDLSELLATGLDSAPKEGDGEGLDAGAGFGGNDDFGGSDADKNENEGAE